MSDVEQCLESPAMLCSLAIKTFDLVKSLWYYRGQSVIVKHELKETSLVNEGGADF